MAKFQTITMKTPYYSLKGVVSESYGIIDSLSVEQPHRRKGFGRLAFERFKKICKRRGVSVIALEVFHENPNAWAFWKSMGAVISSECCEQGYHEAVISLEYEVSLLPVL